ncbi:MAG: HD domain-containing protein [Erysipelotrichaceae bacterium]|nr:HD domain-containing protein [Erysipelotrichaceae bacterium]
MFKKTKETKVLRDVIHGYIHVHYQVIWDCINAKEMQRLRRIHQLGGVYQIYHTAEHSRFSHSLGVYEIVRRMVQEVEDIADQLSESEKIQVMCAGLLHDLGHGPFSHFFEGLQDIDHEQRTRVLIRDTQTEIHQALSACDPQLPEQVVSILDGTHPKEMLHQMISSQLDADRMDYLLRDAYETGTSYGTFDLERILRTMRVENGQICMKESGMHSVEDYIMARYHMYWQVYLHPDVKAYELLIEAFFKRYNDIRHTCPIEALEPFERTLTNGEFLSLDESVMTFAFHQAAEKDDAVLKDLANRILNRKLFHWIQNPDPRQTQAIAEQLTKEQKSLEYYYHESRHASGMYLPYIENTHPIRILQSDGRVVTLSAVSEIVKALLRMETTPDLRIYYG